MFHTGALDTKPPISRSFLRFRIQKRAKRTLRRSTAPITGPPGLPLPPLFLDQSRELLLGRRGVTSDIPRPRAASSPTVTCRRGGGSLPPVPSAPRPPHQRASPCRLAGSRPRTTPPARSPCGYSRGRWCPRSACGLLDQVDDQGETGRVDVQLGPGERISSSCS